MVPRSLLVAAVLTVSCSSGGGGGGSHGCSDDDVASALAGCMTPDGKAVLRQMAADLGTNELLYLSDVVWPDDDGTALLRDPEFAKVIAIAESVVPGEAPSSTPQSLLHVTAGAPAPSDTSYDPIAYGSTYQTTRGLLAPVNGQPFAKSPGVVAAAGVVLAKQILATAGTPVPKPSNPADGKLYACVVTFTHGVASDPQCQDQDFCCNARLNIDDGTSECLDRTSCLSVPEGGAPEAGMTNPNDPCGLAGDWSLEVTRDTCGECTGGTGHVSMTITDGDVAAGTFSPSGFSYILVDAKTCEMSIAPGCPWTQTACTAQCPGALSGSLKNGSGSFTTDFFCSSSQDTCTKCGGALRATLTRTSP